MTLSRGPRRRLSRLRTIAASTPTLAPPSEAAPPQTNLAAGAPAASTPPAALSIPLAVLDGEDDAVVVLSPGGARLYANRSADALIAKGDILALEADVVTARPGWRFGFATAFARTLAGEAPRYDVAVAGTVWTIKFAPLETPFARLCLLRIADLDQRLAAAVTQFASDHDLSRREGQLLLALAQGRSLEDHAHDARVAITTVRSQLGAIFRKCGVARQHEVVAALFASAR